MLPWPSGRKGCRRTANTATFYGYFGCTWQDSEFQSFFSLPSSFPVSLCLLPFLLPPLLPPSSLHFHRVCSPHGDSICSKFFSSRSVLINTTDTTTFESEVKNLVFSLQSLRTSANPIGSLSAKNVSHCVELATETLCHSAFPFCTEQPLTSRPICRRSCDVFRAGGACEGVVTPERFPEAYELMMSRCDDVEFPGGNAPECVQLQLEQSTTAGGKPAPPLIRTL